MIAILKLLLLVFDLTKIQGLYSDSNIKITVPSEKHYHHVVLRAQSSLTLSLSRHLCLSFIALARSSSVCIELMFVSLCWLANTAISICMSPFEKISYEFILTSSAILCMSCSSYLVDL